MRRAQPCAVCHLLVNVPYMFVSTPSAEHSATITITVCGLSISLATPEIDLLHPFISTSTSFMAPGFTTCCTIHQPVEGVAGFSEHLNHSKPFTKVTKGSVSYLSSPCFSTSLGGIGGPARAIHGILAVMYWISIIRGAPPPENGHGFNSHG